MATRDYVEWSNPASFSFPEVILGGRECPAVSRSKPGLGVPYPESCIRVLLRRLLQGWLKGQEGLFQKRGM